MENLKKYYPILFSGLILILGLVVFFLPNEADKTKINDLQQQLKQMQGEIEQVTVNDNLNLNENTNQQAPEGTATNQASPGEVKAALIDNGDGTISDENTALMWQKGQSPIYNWEEAINYCDDLDLAGYSDWFAPEREDLEDLLATQTRRCGPSAGNDFTEAYLDPIFDCKEATVWSATERDDENAWFLDFTNHASNFGSKETGIFSIHCMREEDF